MRLHEDVGRVALLAAVALALGAGEAAASPAFARKYNVSCSSCHAPAYPELNAYGRQFKELGYQYPAGAEPAYRDQNTLTPGTIDERIGLFRELPLAARATGALEVPINPNTAPVRNGTNLRLIEQLYVVGGGSLYKDVSFFFSTSIAPKAVLHHAELGWHNLFGEDVLNLRAGDLLLLDFLQPGHRTITRLGNVAATTTVGLNPTALDTSQLGVEAYGRTLSRQLFWNLAVVQGAVGPDGVADLDSNKDVFGQLQLILHDENVFGVLGYYGRTQITDTARQVAVRFTDPMGIVGVDAEYHLGRFTLFGYGLYGQHNNPTGDGRKVTYLGARGDLTASITRDLVARVRYDTVLSDDDPMLVKKIASAHLTYLLLTNLKISAELDADVVTFNRSTAFALLDVAI